MVVEDLEGKDLALELGVVVEEKVVLESEKIVAGMVVPTVQSNNPIVLGYIVQDLTLWKRQNKRVSKGFSTVDR